MFREPIQIHRVIYKNSLVYELFIQRNLAKLMFNKFEFTSIKFIKLVVSLNTSSVKSNREDHMLYVR